MPLFTLTVVERRQQITLKGLRKKQKKHYDKKAKKVNFKVGDRVLVHNTRKTTRKGGKLASCWTGPFVVQSVLQKGTYKLEGLQRAVNGNRLKLYVTKTKKRMRPNKTNVVLTPRVISNIHKTQEPLKNGLGKTKAGPGIMNRLVAKVLDKTKTRMHPNKTNVVLTLGVISNIHKTRELLENGLKGEAYQARAVTLSL